MKKYITLLLLLVSQPTLSQVYAEYTGKIKSMYIHERDSDPYFGIELEGEMNQNPCGSSKKYFIIRPDQINQHQYSMLLAAHMAKKEVKISNQDTTSEQRCHGSYSRFNMVKVM